MAHQASLNGGSRFQRSEGILTNLGEIGGDVATLAELQAKLALVDAQEAAARATWPLVVLLAGALVAAACLPVLLIGLAFVLAAAMGLSQGVAMLIVGAVVAVVAVLVALLSLREFSHSFESFRRSREEFVRNASWIKTVLAQSTAATRR